MPTTTGIDATGFNAASYGTVNSSEVDGGTLRIGIGESCGVLVPQSPSPYRLAQSGTCRNLQRMVVRGLTAFAPYPGASGMEAVPDLATDLGEVSADGLTVTYQLRDGVRWQDGSPITGDDVVLGLREADHGSSSLQFTSVTANANTITITLAAPMPTIDERLAMTDAVPRPSSGAALASGPFVVSRTSRSGYELERNPQWSAETDPVRSPRSAKAVVTVQPNIDELDRALLSHDLDVVLAPGMGTQTATSLLEDPRTAGDIDNPATGEVTMLAMQETVAPLDNVACRRAVFSAIDRTAIVDATGGPLRRMPAITVSPPNYPSYAGGYEPYPIADGAGDIEAAKAQLVKCNEPDGFTMKVAYPTSASDIFNSIRLALQRIGIIVLGVPIDDGEFATRFMSTPELIERTGVGAVLFSYESQLPSVEAFLAPLVAPVLPAANTNIAQVELRSIDVLVNSTEMGSRDLAIQGDVGKAIDRLILDSVAYIPLTYELTTHYRMRALTNVSVSSAYDSEYNAVNLGTQGSTATASTPG